MTSAAVQKSSFDMSKSGIAPQKKPVDHKKLTAIVMMILGAGVLGGCIFGAVHMGTHSSMYHGATVHIHTHSSVYHGSAAVHEIWDPNAVNHLGKGAILGMTLGFIVGPSVLMLALDNALQACLNAKENQPQAKQNHMQTATTKV